MVESALATADPAGSGHLEPLRSGSVGLHLRHDALDSDDCRSRRPPLRPPEQAVARRKDAGGGVMAEAPGSCQARGNDDAPGWPLLPQPEPAESAPSGC